MIQARIVSAALAAVIVIAAGDAGADPRGPLDLLRPGSQAAVGLGGDPFLSPLRDDVGWWSDLRLDGRPGSIAEIETSRPADLGAGSGFESRQARWSATALGNLARVSWTAGIGLDEPRWDGVWVGGPGALSLRGSGPAATGGIRLDVLPSLSWQLTGSGGSGDGERSSLAAGVRWGDRSRSIVQASWQRARRSDELNSSLYGEPIALSTHLSQESERLEGRWAAPWGIALEGAAARTRWLPREAAVSAAEYRFEPAGASDLNQLAVTWSAPRVRALARWTRVDVDLEGTLSWSGQSFGGLDRARIDLESWLLAIDAATARGSRFLFEVERPKLDARARAYLESWPFTSTLVDLLGQRRIVRLDGTADWSRWHLAHERPWGRATRSRIGLEWIDARPRGRMESWRPAFLVFGKADDHLDRLSVERAQLAVVSLGASRRIARFDLSLGVEQCVMARVKESGPPAASSGDPAALGAAAARSEEGIGTRLRFTTSTRF